MTVSRLAALAGRAVIVLALPAACGRPPAAPSEPPDVLLITVDTLRADRLGVYGYAQAATPVMDRLAARGARFAQVIAPTPLTLPSHASILTATTPLKHGVRDNVGFVLGSAMPTLGEQFQAAGYTTGAFISGFPLHRRFGLARGFDHYDDRLTRGGDRARPAPVERRADETIAAVDAWLREPANVPRPSLFLWVHLFDPHAPYEAPEPYRTRFAERAYDGEVAFADSQIGVLLQRIDQLRRNRPMIVAVTADHGEGLGEHGEPTHGLFVYDSTIRVPLLISGPGVPSGRVIRSMVRLIDVAPTLLDLAGLSSFPSAEGESLRRAVMDDGAARGPAAHVESLFGWLCCGWAPLHAWRDGDWMFIDAPRAELYDTASDAGELHNLAAGRAADASRLRRSLEVAMSQETAAAARTTPSGDARDRLRTLGYVAGGGTTNPSRRDPKDVAALSVRLGQAIEIEDSNPSKAEALLEGVLRADPANPLARRHLGLALMRQRRTADAIRILNALVTDGDTSAETLGLLADAAIERGNLNEARSRLETLTVRDPADTAVALKLGIVLVQAGEIDRAITVFRGIVDREPANADALVDLAGALLTSGRAADAATYFQQAIDNGAQGPLAWNGLGFAKMRSGDRPGAAEAMRRSLRIRPDQPEIAAALRDLGMP